MHDPENYDKLKLRYLGRNVAADTLFVPTVDKLKLKTQKQQKIMDFGCGTGLFAATYLLPLAEETDSKIIGLDISEEMIRHATEKYSHERLTFKCGDIMSDQFSLGESNFDQIISFYVLHFIKDYKEALRRLYGLLKPGGQCCLVVSAKHNQFQSYKLLGQDPKWSPYMKGYEEFCPDWIENWDTAGEEARKSIGKAVDEIGFKTLELSLKDMTFTCDSLDLHVAFVLTLNPFINAVPKEMHGELQRSLLSHICNLYGYPDTEEFHAKPYTDTHYEALVVLLEKPM